MTAGERMVWAAAFVDILHRGGSEVDAARHAALSVRSMRAARNVAIKLPAEQRPIDAGALAMLDAMLSDDREGRA